VPDAETEPKSWTSLEGAPTAPRTEPSTEVATLSHFGREHSAGNSLGRLEVPTIIYIGGYGRGGTSMLDLMLGAAPGVLGAGELFRLWSGRLEDQCVHSSSRPVAQFVEFWSEIERRVGVPRLEGERIRRLIEERKIMSRPPPGGLFHDYSWMMWKLFSTLSELGFKYVVDSSKNSRPTALRPFYLRQCGLRLYFVHLRRSFVDTMSSVAQGTNRQFLEGQSDLLRVPRAAIGFHLAHSAANRWRREGGQAYLRLSFERLVCDPAPEIAVLCGRVGMDAGPIIDRLSQGKPFRVGYQIGGNRLFRSGDVFFRRSLPPRQSSASVTLTDEGSGAVSGRRSPIAP
jgi:hypothetical protein